MYYDIVFCESQAPIASQSLLLPQMDASSYKGGLLWTNKGQGNVVRLLACALGCPRRAFIQCNN